MNRKWMAVTAGVIDVIHGAAAVIFGVLLIFIVNAFEGIAGSSPWYSYPLLAVIIILGAVAIAGGITTIKRKSWALALSGAIGAFLLSLWSLEYWLNMETYGIGVNTLWGFIGIPAIIAIVLTALSKEQFSR